MSSTIKFVCFGIFGLIATVAVVLMVGAPSAEAQLSDLAPGDSKEEFRPPGFQVWCKNDRCPGQTCDEVNHTCVGDVTLQPAMGEPLVGLHANQLNHFNEGAVLFDKTFTVADGLGPVFNQDGCGSCHNAPLGGSGTITVTRFGQITVDGSELIFNPLAEFGGSLLNKESISPECAEIIPVPPTNVAAQRLTNSTLGFGLVEAILDVDIEFNALNPPPGVSGVAQIVPVLEDPPMTRIGRFGWKTQLATVESFTADAMLQEMGITSRIFPEDNPPNNDFVLLAACDTVADPEDVPNAEGDEFLKLTTAFQRFLAPPPQTPRSGMTGEGLFGAVGCADCHMTGFVATGDDDTEDAIRGETVNAYSDFLLHDMGGNGDFIEQGGAGLTEIRTTPLWGMRIRDPLWHDGRVAGGTFDFRIFNAILLHDAFGSEAQASAQAYFALSPADQIMVGDFLDSLGKREFDMDGNGRVDDADVMLVDDCVAGVGPYSADDFCAVADADQSGFVDAADVDLLNVVLGLVDDDGSSDDEDDDANGALSRGHFVREGTRASGDKGGIQGLDARAPDLSAQPDATEPEEDRQRRRAQRRTASRRGL
jgi:CxxC motif-containing protein (DUF1111 family)